MHELAQRAVGVVREVDTEGALANELGVLLEKFSDVRVTDSTVHVIKRLASHWAPSTSKDRPAAVKLHSVISLSDQLPVHSEIGPQRVHDSRAFDESTMQPGTLMLMDLGYIDIERFIDAIAKGADFLTRLKSSHKPEIVRVRVGKGSRVAARGMKLDDALEQGTLALEHGIVDVDVRLQSKGKQATARIVGVFDTEHDDIHFYLTSVSHEILNARDVCDAYRLRWEVELLFKQLKSGAGLSSILAWRESAVCALIHSKVIALCLARMLELSVARQAGDRVHNKLALMLVLSRMMPLMLTAFLLSEGTTIEKLERRILFIAATVARSRNQRRDRMKRQREQRLGRSG
jgi:hypothetical protein